MYKERVKDIYCNIVCKRKKVERIYFSRKIDK